MSIIEDGKGRGFVASVSSSNRLNSSTKANPRIYYISRDDGQAFSFTSEYSATSGDYVIYLKNTNADKQIVISGIWLSSDNNAKWCIDKVSGTASGTEITGRSLNFTKNNLSDSTSIGDNAVSGLTKTFSVAPLRGMGFTTNPVDFKETLILGNGDAIAVKYTGTSGDISATIGMYFEKQSGAIN